MVGEKVHVDSVNTAFSKVMKVCTLMGITVMIVFGLLYLTGINPYLDTSSVVNHWGKPATVFWEEAKGIRVNDYSWFLFHLTFMDSLSMVGIFLLALTPLISVIVMIPRSKKIYTILLLILTAEFIFSIIRPLI